MHHLITDLVLILQCIYAGCYLACHYTVRAQFANISTVMQITTLSTATTTSVTAATHLSGR
jgi:hypothetical protein